MNSLCKSGAFAIILAVEAGGLPMSATAAPAAESGTTVNSGWQVIWDAESARMIHVETGKEVEIYRDKNIEAEDMVEGESGMMLSVVGPVLSWSASWYFEGGAHPSYGTAYRTIDLSKLDPAGDKDGTVRLQEANLAELFGKEAVFRQLAADPHVRAAIKGEFSEIGGEKHATPNSLDELLEAADGGCRAYMGDRLIKDFAFLYRAGRRTAAVQIGLSHGCEVMRGEFTELRPIFLRIPDALADDFQQALESGMLEYRPFQDASFDCEKAESPIEYAICTDFSEERLAFLDRSMAQWYSLQRKKLEGEEKARLRSDQRDWIKKRDSTCEDAAGHCLRELYIERMRDMKFPYMKELESR